jgi:hypothetical protein
VHKTARFRAALGGANRFSLKASAKRMRWKDSIGRSLKESIDQAARTEAQDFFLRAVVNHSLNRGELSGS